MVKHLIVFNTAHAAWAQAVEAMARQARDVLSRISGVQGVSFGVAVAEAVYRYLLIVDFADAAVIDVYRSHPVHVQFANEVFRPLAVQRLTTDFRMMFEAGPPRG